MAKSPKGSTVQSPSTSLVRSNGHAPAVADISSFTGRKRIRKTFGRIPEAVNMPNLIEVQRASYDQFLQREVRSSERRDEGIEAVF